MPVTAVLSKNFYEKFGQDVTNELVNWFNAVDATYRADLTQLNELNFSRFDAKLEQRLVELDAKWRQRWAELDAKLEQRLLELDAKWGQRSAILDAKLEQRLLELDAKWGQRWVELDAKLEQRLAEVRTEMAAMKADLIKWMFVFWAPTALAVVGTGVGVVSLLLRR
jgi:hypothetical protein